MDVEIRVDRSRCIGSGQCVHWAPGVFDQDEAAISVVVDPRGEPEEKVVQAVVGCPVQAITLDVGGSRVGPDDLHGWIQATHSPDPIVSTLEQLSLEHHELRTALDGSRSGADAARAEELCTLTSDHLRDEDRVYSAIAALVGPRLVDAFRDDHTQIERALGDLAAHRADPVERGRAIGELASAVDDHIRLEETVLFPVALAALARQPSPEAVSR